MQSSIVTFRSGPRGHQLHGVVTVEACCNKVSNFGPDKRASEIITCPNIELIWRHLNGEERKIPVLN